MTKYHKQPLISFSGLKVVNTEPYLGPQVPDNTATLLLKVTSVNTHDPTFTQTIYNIQILESMPTGSNILTLVMLTFILIIDWTMYDD